MTDPCPDCARTTRAYLVILAVLFVLFAVVTVYALTKDPLLSIAALWGGAPIADWVMG